ncbi:MAG: YceD family protein [Novosphingobium sp.]
MSEFSRIYRQHALPAGAQQLVATAEECAALAKRFDLIAVTSLDATVALTPDGPNVQAKGRLQAQIVQPCAVSAEELDVTIDEPVALRFVPALAAPDPDAEIELAEGELDDIEMAGGQFDLGEALAQSLGLAIDPYLTGPLAEEARRRAGLVGEGETGPFAALKGLLKD